MPQSHPSFSLNPSPPPTYPEFLSTSGTHRSRCIVVPSLLWKEHISREYKLITSIVMDKTDSTTVAYVLVTKDSLEVRKDALEQRFHNIVVKNVKIRSNYRYFSITSFQKKQLRCPILLRTSVPHCRTAYDSQRVLRLSSESQKDAKWAKFAKISNFSEGFQSISL